VPDAFPPPPVPDKPTLPKLRKAAPRCRACDLWKPATQVVFSEGSSRARLMLVGEQPGDVEDEEGKVFVGPAGRLLDRALDEAGIERRRLYLTNAVKHFRFEERGKRRIHQKPTARQVAACAPWLDAELRVVKPRVVLALGAVAAGALFGSEVRVTRDRGRPLDVPDFEPTALVTVHPSSVLRSRDAAERAEAFAAFRDDLVVAAKHAAG
jgi:uracil-DNA glycosylase